MLLSVLYIIGITAEGITGALAAGREVQYAMYY